jgi:hypothetical protein
MPQFRYGILIDEGFKKEVLELAKDNPTLTKLVSDHTSHRVPVLNAQLSSRVIKTHLPFSLLPQNLLRIAKVFLINFKMCILNNFSIDSVRGTQP